MYFSLVPTCPAKFETSLFNLIISFVNSLMSFGVYFPKNCDTPMPFNTSLSIIAAVADQSMLWVFIFGFSAFPDVPPAIKYNFLLPATSKIPEPNTSSKSTTTYNLSFEKSVIISYAVDQLPSLLDIQIFLNFRYPSSVRCEKQASNFFPERFVVTPILQLKIVAHQLEGSASIPFLNLNL